MFKTAAGLASVLTLAVALLLPLGAASAGECDLHQIAAIPATLSPGNAVLLDVTINGVPAKMELDTGASVSALGKRFAERIGMPIEDMPGVVYGLGGVALNEKTRIESLQLGTMHSNHEAFVLTPLFGDGSNGGPVGLFGGDYLQNYDVEIDVSGGMVKLFDQRHCEDRVVYWAPDFFKLPISLRGEGLVRRPMLDVTVDGKSLKAILDTGAASNVMRLATAQSTFGLTPGSPDTPQIGFTTGIEGRKLEEYEHAFQSLAFGPITLHNTKLAIVPINVAAHTEKTGSRLKVGAADEPDLYIGMALIKQLHLYLSYGEKAVYFTVANPKQAAAQ